MARDEATTEQLRKLISQVGELTVGGKLKWEKQLHSMHRYARWKNNLLILGPDEPLTNKSIPRYLLITPFDSPDYIEINSNDDELGDMVLELVETVEHETEALPSSDPFAVTEEVLNRLIE